MELTAEDKEAGIHPVLGFGFRVQGSGFTVQGSGFRVQGLVPWMAKSGLLSLVILAKGIAGDDLYLEVSQNWGGAF